MKSMIVSILALVLLNSCVFEDPFEAKALVPVDAALLGRWQEIKDKSAEPANGLLVLQHSENEYLVEYPVGEKAMYFRAFLVELSGGRHVQIQLIGTADGPVEAQDRKYHLLKVAVDGDVMQLRTIDPAVLGEGLKGSQALRESFEARKDAPGLFEKPIRFKRGS
jgi:hypothetical protein